MWEGGIRVPAVIEWPARIKPAITDTPAGVVDIFPTLVELLALKVERPVPLDGISLLPLLDGKMTARPQPIGFWQFAGKAGTLTTDSGPSAWNDNRYKLVKTKTGTLELYDIAADRTERNDIAAAHPEIVAQMKAQLEEWQQSVVRSYNGEDYPKPKDSQPAK
jgi:arylsulfatase A-like enzyme